MIYSGLACFASNGGDYGVPKFFHGIPLNFLNHALILSLSMFLHIVFVDIFCTTFCFI